MSKERLSKYRYLCAEVELLQRQLARLCLAATKLRRRKDKADYARISDLCLQLEGRKRHSEEELCALYSYINSVEDAALRVVFALRYIENLSWRQIANTIGECDEQYPRRLHNNYLKKMV